MAELPVASQGKDSDGNEGGGSIGAEGAQPVGLEPLAARTPSMDGWKSGFGFRQRVQEWWEKMVPQDQRKGKEQIKIGGEGQSEGGESRKDVGASAEMKNKDEKAESKDKGWWEKFVPDQRKGKEQIKAGGEGQNVGGESRKEDVGTADLKNKDDKAESKDKGGDGEASRTSSDEKHHENWFIDGIVNPTKDIGKKFASAFDMHDLVDDVKEQRD
eukprot:479112-Rhodomonas_salina.1